MVATLHARALHVAGAVTDPEIPVLTIADLGILRGVTVTGETVEVTITPTYTGCPAMTVIKLEIELALARAGIQGHVRTVLAPAWTTDWLTEDGKEKLRAYGIAAPPGRGRGALFGTTDIACPQCHSTNTQVLSEFGSTACKSLWRCNACWEPFDTFKCH